MEEMAYNELALEKRIEARFDMSVDIKKVILYRVSVGPAAVATLFMSEKKQVYLYLDAQTKLTLGDVRKIVIRMGLKAEAYLPPKKRPNYFSEVGAEKFREVFPGRKNINETELTFYKTLAPYNPALVLIGEVRDGRIYCYDADSNTTWRVAAKFNYHHIKTK